MSAPAKIRDLIRTRPEVLALFGVLLFMNVYAFSGLKERPEYWYDEGLNVELSRSVAEFGIPDIVIAPDTLSESGARIGSTGYPITVLLGGVFKIFGVGVVQARLCMLLWMNALVISLFFAIRKRWGSQEAIGTLLLCTTFAPFYGNGLTVMGEIPGLFFLLWSFYFFEQKTYWKSGLLLGLSVVSKPSVYLFFIPAFTVALLFGKETGREKLKNLCKLGVTSIAALVPWVLIYRDSVSRVSFWEGLFSHFKNPYGDFGFSVWGNIQNNLGGFFHSSTLIYFSLLTLAVLCALAAERSLAREHRTLLVVALVYLPLSFFQYLKSLGYLRYLIATEFLLFLLFVLVLPTLTRFALNYVPFLSVRVSRAAGAVLTVLILFQAVHLFWFSDLYSGRSAEMTVAYIQLVYPEGVIGIINAPQVGSLISPHRKYQYLSTFGLTKFGVNPVFLAPEKMPVAIVTDGKNNILSLEEQELLLMRYAPDVTFTEDFLVYKKK